MSSSDLGPRYIMVHLHSRHSALGAEKKLYGEGQKHGNDSQPWGLSWPQALEATDYDESWVYTTHIYTPRMSSPAHMISCFILWHQKKSKTTAPHAFDWFNREKYGMRLKCGMTQPSKIVWHSKNLQDNLCALSIASALLIHSSHGVRVIHLGFEVDLQHLKPNGMHQAFRSGNLRLSHLRGSNKHHVRNVVSMSRQQNYTEIPWHPKPFENVWKPCHSLPNQGFWLRALDRWTTRGGLHWKNGREICRDTNLSCGCFIHLWGLRQAMSPMDIFMKGWMKGHNLT